MFNYLFNLFCYIRSKLLDEFKVAELVKLKQVKQNPNNPRFIKDEKFEKLVMSIVLFPQMMAIRPIVVDENWYSLGGNMRDRACIEIKNRGLEYAQRLLKDTGKHTAEQQEAALFLLSPIYKGNFPDGWVKQELNLTEEQKREFLIKDNAAFGQFDWEMLANDFDIDDLTDWGVDIPNITFGDDEEEEKVKVNKLTFTFPIKEDFNSVKKSLKAIAETNEEALMVLIQFYEENAKF